MSITKLKLNADIKDIGRIITANPQGDATEQLTKLGINGTIYEVAGSGSGGVATITKAITPNEDEETFTFDEEFTAEEFETIFNENAILHCVYAPVEGIAQNLYLYKNLSIQQVDEESSTRVVFLQTTQEGTIFNVSITNADGDIGAEFSVVQPLQLENYTFNANDENWSDIELEFANRVNRVDNLQNAVFIVNYDGISYYGRAENSEFITFKLNENTTRYFNITNGTFNDVFSDNELNLNYMGAWVSDNEYFKNDLVLDTTDNQIYICVNEIIGGTTAPSNDNAKWHLFIPTANVFIGVEISDVPSSATNGTLTETQLDLLTKNDNNYIMFAHEKYYLNDKGHTEGFLTYSHLGATSDKIIAKTITITLNTRAWVLLEKEIGAGTTIIDITGLDIIPTQYQDAELLKTAILFDVDHLLRLTWIDDMYYYGNTDDFQYRYLSVDTNDFIIMRYDLQDIAKASKFINLNDTVPTSATNGTITSTQLTILQNNDQNYIVFNNEIYRLADKQHESGYLVYTHNGNDTTGSFFQKCITITISTLAWVLEEQQVDGGGGIEIVDISSWGTSVPEEYRDIERLKKIVLYENKKIYYCDLIGDPANTIKFTCYHTDVNASDSTGGVQPYTRLEYYNISTNEWTIFKGWSQSGNTFIKAYYQPSSYVKANKNLKILQVGNSARFQVAAQSVDFNTLLSIPNTATNGTITSDMLTTLQLSDENYILLNNEIYLLQDKNTTDGFLVYTHNGHDSNGAYFQKCITITISTLGWVLNATQLATTSDIDNAIGNALQGDY